MKDTILRGFVRNFAQERGISATDDRLPHVFEAFSAYSILRKYHDFDASEPKDQVVIGGGGDGGLDAVAILINQRLVRSIEDVDYFLEESGRFNVEYVFIQAKLSTSFSSESIGHFIYGVERFFSHNTDHSTSNKELTILKQISNHLMENTINMYTNPVCHLYFVTTGKWNNEAKELVHRMDDGKQKLIALNLFSQVKISAVDANELKSMYRDLKHSVVKDIEFPNCATFPEIEDVEQAYVGLLSGDQYLRLIARDDGSLNRDLFYSNIRDFQGDNAVNEEIHQTISSSENKINFPLLNNGVTIVARSITRTGNRFTIADYQIVNGCQTTHVLHLNKLYVDARIFIPVKLVATNNSRIIGEIIKANNRQTEIKPEAWESLTPFHKELEDFYSHQKIEDERRRIYYERRSKQYIFDNIPPARIITLPRQVYSFIGMFLNEPHVHYQYYGQLLKQKKQLFSESHKADPYYTSGITLLAAERLIDKIARESSQYKYHLLMLLRLQIGGRDMPPLNSKAISTYCSSIIDCVVDEMALLDQFRKSVRRLRQCRREFALSSDGYDYGRNPDYRRREFTKILLHDG